MMVVDVRPVGRPVPQRRVRASRSVETWPLSEHFPATAAPSSEAEWHELVADFLESSERVVQLSHDPDWLQSPDPGYEDLHLTWRDALEFLAVQTAYHLGKIVASRQSLGAWPPSK